MQDFISKNKLDPDAVRGHGFAARIYPEYPSEDEISHVADLVGAGEIEFWVSEYGKPLRHVERQAVATALVGLFQNSPDSLLVRFVDQPLCIWAPEDHEYLVLFGEPDLVRQVQLSASFTYDFADYVSSDHLSARTREHLAAALQAYSIG